MMMNLYTLKIIILNILLFNSNVVYCNETGKKSLNPFEVNTNNNTTNNSLNTLNIERISPNLTFNCGNYQEVLTTKFVYEIANSQRAKLSHPNTIDKIKLADYTFHFDENTILPNINIDHITIYTCIHNIPALLYMHGDSSYYYYSLNPKTNKWSNHRIQYDTTLFELTDPNGVYYYKLSLIEHDADTQFKYEDKELVKKFCKQGDSTNFNVAKSTNIDVYIKRFNISNSSNNQIKQPQFVPAFNVNKNVPSNTGKSMTNSSTQTNDFIPTNVYYYKILPAVEEKLVYPNKLDVINFNNYMIRFDENASLPSNIVDYIYIYTCKHKSPVLLLMYCDFNYYYYSLDPRSNKWNNHVIKYDESLVKNVDDNGTLYYTKLDDDITLNDKYEDVELVKQICRDDRCPRVNANNDRDLDFIFKNSSVPKVSNGVRQKTLVLSTSFNNTVTSSDSAYWDVYYKSTTRILFYTIDETIRPKLTYPSRLDRINFNGYMIQFDNNTILPNLGVDHMAIYTCVHNNPMFIYMYGDSSYYYYSLNPKTNKWSNHRIQYDMGLREYVDPNGVYYYKISLVDKEDFSTIKFEYIEIIKQKCRENICPRISVDKDRNVDFIFKTSNVFNVSSDQLNQVQPAKSGSVVNTGYFSTNTANRSVPNELFHETYESPLNVFHYEIDSSHQSMLLYPNKLDRIDFNGYMIQFDENARLPNVVVDFVYIYTCKHNNPVLMFMYGGSRFYYYSLDPRSNKWNNYRIKYDTGLKEYRDQKGTSYYKIYFDGSHIARDVREERVLVNEACKGFKCLRINANRERNIQIYMKSGAPQVIKFQSPNTSQLYNVRSGSENTPSISTGMFGKADAQTVIHAYDYKIDGYLQLNLRYPNKLDRIDFNGYMIQFDENAKLPNIYVEYIYIYTCKHNNPIFMYLQFKSIYYFYSVDPRTNKWNNHRIKYDTGLDEYMDNNGTFYYVVSIFDNKSPSTDKYEDIELVKQICREDRCPRISVNPSRNLQVYMKNLDVPKVSNNRA